MEEIELFFCPSEEEGLIRSLDNLHCNYSTLLARFLLAMQYQYPITDTSIEIENFMASAIQLVNDYSTQALPILKKNWIEIQNK